MLPKDPVWLNNLLAKFNPADTADRLQLSDLMEEAGRMNEALLLRRLALRVWLDNGTIRISQVHFYWDEVDPELPSYRVYAVRSEDRQAFVSMFTTAERISQTKAIKIGYTLPRRMNQHHGRIQGQFIGPHISIPTNVDEAIGYALADTFVLMLKNGYRPSQMVCD